MKKTILVLMSSMCLMVCLFFNSSCNRKAFATQPNPRSNDTTYITFSKLLKERLEHDNIDITKIQFYLDQKITLRRLMGSEKGTVKSGIILFDNGQSMNELVIPAYTPGVCEKVDGGNLKVSFDVMGKTLEFGALYGNNNFVLVGTNWHLGMVDVMYDNATYQVACGSCSSVAEAKIVVRKNQTYQKEITAKVVAGRKLN
jgi:hypothetical protein